MGAALELTAKEFEPIIKQDGIVLIDFWAPWCGPCRSFAPVYDKVAEANPDVTFAKVNTEQEQELAGALRIQAIPTLMVFRDQILLYSEAGALPQPALEELIKKVRELDMEQVKAEIAKQGENDGAPPATGPA